MSSSLLGIIPYALVFTGVIQANLTLMMFCHQLLCNLGKKCLTSLRLIFLILAVILIQG